MKRSSMDAYCSWNEKRGNRRRATERVVHTCACVFACIALCATCLAPSAGEAGSAYALPEISVSTEQSSALSLSLSATSVAPGAAVKGVLAIAQDDVTNGQAIYAQSAKPCTLQREKPQF